MLLMSFKEENIILRTSCEVQSWAEHDTGVYDINAPQRFKSAFQVKCFTFFRASVKQSLWFCVLIVSVYI